MSASGPKGAPWGQRGKNREEHASLLLAEAQQLLTTATTTTTTDTNGRQTLKKAKPITAAVAKLFLDSVITYLKGTKEAEGQGDALKQVLHRLEIIEAAQKRGLQQTPGAKSYASVASWGHTSPASSTSTAPQPIHTTVTKACEIRVNIRDATVSKSLQQKPKPAQHIIDTVNASIAQIDGNNKGAQATAKWVRAARILKSGDVVLHAVDAPTAERLLFSSEKWQSCLGEKARVLTTTYGVVVSNIPTKDVDMANQQAITDKIRDENQHLIGQTDIDRVYWLGRPKPGKTDNAIVVEFKSAAAANSCLAERLAWDGNPKKTERYLKDCQICQCFKCHSYGHTARSCTTPEKCGYCSAQDHTTKLHPNPKDSTTHKCPLCRKNHPAWSLQCEHRKSAVVRITEAKKYLKANPWFPETPIITPGVSQRGSRQSSDNGVPTAPQAIQMPTTPQSSPDEFPTLTQLCGDRRAPQTTEKTPSPLERSATPEPREDLGDDGYTPVRGKKRGVRRRAGFGEPVTFTGGGEGPIYTTGSRNRRKFFSPYKQQAGANAINFQIPETNFSQKRPKIVQIEEAEADDVNGALMAVDIESPSESVVGSQASSSSSSGGSSEASSLRPATRSQKTTQETSPVQL